MHKEIYFVLDQLPVSAVCSRHTHRNNFYTSLILPKKTLNMADNIWSKNEFTYTEQNLILCDWFASNRVSLGQCLGCHPMVLSASREQCCQFSNFVTRFSDFPTPFETFFKSLGTNIATSFLETLSKFSSCPLIYIHLYINQWICHYDVI